MKKTTAYTARNKKIAASRGEEWKKKLVEGKHDSQMNPTVIKIIRVQQGISQAAIAKELGVSLATYGSIERGTAPVKKPMAKFIADYYKIKIEKAFKEENERFIANKA